MKIVFCKGQILGPISGADETLVNYATQLRKAGHNVEVLLMYFPSPEDPHYLRLLEADVHVSGVASDLAQTSLVRGRRYFHKLLRSAPFAQRFVRGGARRVVTGLSARYYERCRAYFEKSRADLIHVITPDPAAMVMIRAGHDAGIPVIYQELGTPYHPPGFESYYREFVSVLPLCTEIVALSPMLAEQCREKLPKIKALSVLPILTDEVSNGRKLHGAVSNGVTFGFAARMEKLKGTTVLMEAFGAASLKSPGICLKVAGDGSQRRMMSERAGSLDVSDHYHYVGIYTRPEERWDFMQSLDVFVMPSFTEGTPNSIIEAMSQGKPIIASGVGGIPDVVNAESGILVPPGDMKALSEAILRLAQDAELRVRMGEAARARYQKLFSPKAALPMIGETYRRVAAGNGADIPTNGNGNTHSHPWTSRLN
jgi:glycosyltransferase involved in cell wall biosynthesis